VSELPRVVGLPGAVLLGLGSIVGTGAFVSLGLAAGLVGPGVVLAVALAAVVATCNGLSSAQLAASHPVSGGTYEYGYRLLSPGLGFAAGWMFLCAKSASAATAALGVAGYLGHFLTVPVPAPILAALIVAAVTALVAGGMRRSSRVNAIIVAVTLAALAALVGVAAPRVSLDLGGLAGGDALFEATALVFVAFTGYGRIATLGEEVRDPARVVPRAIVVTLLISVVLYAAIALVAVGVLGADGFAVAARRGAPLEEVARQAGGGGLAVAVSIGAVTAMLGVLLNLVLGLSRVALAMARRGDLPSALSRVDGDTHATPRRAVLAVGVVIAGLALAGSIAAAWSFSAVTVLVYYAITNLAALRQPAAERRFPRAIAVVGLAACLSLIVFIEARVGLAALAILVAGLLGHAIAQRRRRRRVD
jgi:APA family basic amino acid/polyamine antiporter